MAVHGNIYWRMHGHVQRFSGALVACLVSGSVRQIVDGSGNSLLRLARLRRFAAGKAWTWRRITLAESYEPYGGVLTNTGTASSIFAYASERLMYYSLRITR